MRRVRAPGNFSAVTWANTDNQGAANAILGPLGYRVILECKTAKTVVTQPDAAEVARFVERFDAQNGALIGPEFSDETELLQELQTHKIAALSVTDLQTLLQLRASALEVRQL